MRQSVAAIGPSICRQHYSIDRETRDLFLARGFEREFGEVNAQGRYPVDLPLIDRRILLGLGLSEERIYTAPWCTWEASELKLPSYRRDHGLNGMLGGVVFHV